MKQETTEKTNCPECQFENGEHSFECSFYVEKEIKLTGWWTILEYALPNRLSQKEKQIIRNNVALLLEEARQEERERIKEIIKYLSDVARGENKMIPPKLLDSLLQAIDKGRENK